MRPFVEEVFQAILDSAPSVISFALGQAAELVERSHDVGALFVQQVHTVAQARQAAENGADVIIAQGEEAGGFGGGAGDARARAAGRRRRRADPRRRCGWDRGRARLGGRAGARGVRRERGNEVPGVSRV